MEKKKKIMGRLCRTKRLRGVNGGTIIGNTKANSEGGGGNAVRFPITADLNGGGLASGTGISFWEKGRAKRRRAERKEKGGNPGNAKANQGRSSSETLACESGKCHH